MPRRQTLPEQWLVADHRLGRELERAVRRLPSGSGILFLYRELGAEQRKRLLARVRRLASSRHLLVLDEAAGEAARVHDVRELRRVRLARTPVLFLSPVFATRSHPRWPPLKRRSIVAMLRLARAPVIALGGMNARRFRSVGKLGFAGWAAIDAWIAGSKPTKT
jgi:thiamine-phosphate pyrophosphorylase